MLKIAATPGGALHCKNLDDTFRQLAQDTRFDQPSKAHQDDQQLGIIDSSGTATLAHETFVAMI